MQQNVITWTNLGFLYYHHADFELANEAFSRAQVIDSDYSLVWLGQALVATANRHEFDAQTLLTHAATYTMGFVSFPRWLLLYTQQIVVAGYRH